MGVNQVKRDLVGKKKQPPPPPLPQYFFSLFFCPACSVSDCCLKICANIREFAHISAKGTWRTSLQREEKKETYVQTSDRNIKYRVCMYGEYRYLYLYAYVCTASKRISALNSGPVECEFRLSTDPIRPSD